MKALLAALALATTLGTLAVPAAAQSRFSGGYEDTRGYHDLGRWERRAEILPERSIVRIVHREGFAEIETIRLRRDTYLVEAVRPNGAVFRLSLDAYDGRLVDRERIGWSRGPDPRDYGRPRGVEFRFGF